MTQADSKRKGKQAMQLSRKQTEELFAAAPIGDVDRAIVSAWIQQNHPSQAAVQQILLRMFRDGQLTGQQYWSEVLTRVLLLSEGVNPALPSVELVSSDCVGVDVRNRWGQDFQAELTEQGLLNA